MILSLLSTERRRHDVHVLFGDVSYDVRNPWCVNNKIKQENLLFFSEYHKIFISCNENIQIFTLALHSGNTDIFFTLDENVYGIHNKRVNILNIDIRLGVISL